MLTNLIMNINGKQNKIILFCSVILFSIYIVSFTHPHKAFANDKILNALKDKLNKLNMQKEPLERKYKETLDKANNSETPPEEERILRKSLEGLYLKIGAIAGRIKEIKTRITERENEQVKQNKKKIGPGGLVAEDIESGKKSAPLKIIDLKDSAKIRVDVVSGDGARESRRSISFCKDYKITVVLEEGHKFYRNNSIDCTLVFAQGDSPMPVDWDRWQRTDIPNSKSIVVLKKQQGGIFVSDVQKLELPPGSSVTEPNYIVAIFPDAETDKVHDKNIVKGDANVLAVKSFPPLEEFAIKVEVYDKEGDLRHTKLKAGGGIVSGIHFGDRIDLKVTGNPFRDACDIAYEWSFSKKPETSKALLSPLDKDATSLAGDKLGFYQIAVSAGYRIGNVYRSKSAGIIFFVDTMDIDLGFFSGGPDEKKSKKRLKKVKTGKYGYLGEDNGFEWWKKHIEDNCFVEIEYNLLPDDLDTMGTINGYSPNGKKTIGRDDRWLVGPQNALTLLGPPSQTFHVAVFHNDRLWFLDEGELVKKDHVIYDRNNKKLFDLVMTRPNPYGFPAREWVAEHEIGHLFGLKHPHGGIMSKDRKEFKRHEFKKEWCSDIIKHLNEFPLE